MNRRFVVVLGLSALLALVVSAIFYQITTSASAPRRASMETRNVVVATSPLALGAPIKSADLKVVPWPSNNVPRGAFEKLDEVVDRVAVSNILPEEPVLEGRLAARGAGLGLSPIIPPGMRAVSVRVNDVVSVAGFVLPGSRVDVIVTGVPRGAENHTGPLARTILSNLLVISAGKNIQPDATGQPENVPVVTLLVSPDQAEVLTLASIEGRIQLSLRNNTDAEATASGGIRAAEIFPAAQATAPAPRRAAAAPRAPQPVAVAAAPPPPAPPSPQMELIRGNRKTTELIEAHPR
jgi:pilus assembly protein CpaB